MKKRGQVSVEFMIVAAFGLLIISGVIYMVTSQIHQQADEFNMAQLKKFGNSITDTINKLSYMGDTSSLTVDQALPSGIVNVTLDRSPTSVSNRSILFWYRSGDSISPVVFISPVDVAIDFTNLAPGPKKVIITSRESNTLICLKTNSYNCNGICNFDQGENYTNAPSDCCRSDCRGCTSLDKPSVCGTTEPPAACHDICYGHNGCASVC